MSQSNILSFFRPKRKESETNFEADHDIASDSVVVNSSGSGDGDNHDNTKLTDAFSLMFDETTDISCIEQMVIHERYINSTGDVCVKYMKILDALEIGSTDMNELDDCVITLNANKIAEKVTDYIEQNNLEYQTLCGIGTDGAPVMTGKTNGAVKQIIDRQCDKQQDVHFPQKPIAMAIGQHCSAHKLNLVARHAANVFPVITNFKKLLKELHAFYKRSAVRNTGLSAVQKLLHETLEETGHVPDPSETRWLALGNCAIKLKNILITVLVSLERESTERGDVKAAGLFHTMTKFDFVATLLLLCDILPTINILSCLFQESKLDFTRINTSLAAMVRSLRATQAEDNTTAIREFANKFQSQGITLKCKVNRETKESQSLEDEIKNFNEKTKVPFIDAIVNNLDDRFQHSEYMAAFSYVFEPSNYKELENEVKEALNVHSCSEAYRTIRSQQRKSTHRNAELCILCSGISWLQFGIT